MPKQTPQRHRKPKQNVSRPSAASQPLNSSTLPSSRPGTARRAQSHDSPGTSRHERPSARPPDLPGPNEPLRSSAQLERQTSCDLSTGRNAACVQRSATPERSSERATAACRRAAADLRRAAIQGPFPPSPKSLYNTLAKRRRGRQIGPVGRKLI